MCLLFSNHLIGGEISSLYKSFVNLLSSCINKFIIKVLTLKNKNFTMAVMWLLLLIVIVLLTIFIYSIKRNLNYWKNQGIPNEKPHPIMGNIKGLRSTRQIGEIMAEYYKKFKGLGPFAGIHLMQRPAVVLLDKQLIKDVLMKDFHNFADRGLYFNESTDPLTGHLFLLNGTKWKTLRHKLTSTFTSLKLKNMFPTLLENAERLGQVIREKIKADPIINIQHLLGCFTIDNVSSCFLGIECNSLANNGSEFSKMGEKALVQPRHSAFIMSLIEGFPKLARLLGMRILNEDVHRFFMKTFKATMAYREAHQIQRHDLMNTLIELKNQNSKDFSNLKVEELCAQAFVFFMEGFETSTSLISIALYELAQQPDLQERLREEIQATLASSEDGVLSYQQLKDMPYLEQVIAETLRKYPVMPLINRQALNDYTVADNPKYQIKKGMRVLIPLLGLHHDAEYYAEPEKFDPERFTPELAKERDPVEYLPFGDGPRRCFGERFGQMQTRVGLAYLIQQFRFSTCAKTVKPLTFNPKAQPLVPQNGVFLKLEQIK